MSDLNEWIDKAETDYKAAVDLNRRRREPLPDIVCYHCQQCAEKYLKAYLVAQYCAPPAIHDLRQLLRLCAGYDASFHRLRAHARHLNPYGVLIRYPGLSATRDEARDAMIAVRRFRLFIRQKLKL